MLLMGKRTQTHWETQWIGFIYRGDWGGGGGSLFAGNNDVIGFLSATENGS